MHRSLATLLAAASAAPALAGPLNPPAGPVTSSYKTISDAAPRTAVGPATTPGDASSLYIISQPGSYYLTSNIQGQPGKSSIVITSKGVNLDLSGFTIQGGGAGVLASGAAVSDIVVTNGRITGCSAMGVNLGICSDSEVQDLRISACSGGGVAVGSHAAVRRVHIDACAQTGLALGYYALAARCSVADGVAPSSGGVYVCTGDRLVDCTSQQNTGAGFLAAGTNNESLLMTRCLAAGNTAGNFDLHQMSRGVLDSCTSLGGAAPGFQLGAGFTIRACTASDSAQDGFVLQGDGTLAQDCIADANLIGFTVGSDATVKHCKATGNTRQGFRVSGYSSTLLGNTAQDNGAGFAGIWIDGGTCRVEGNCSTGNGYGFYVSGTLNLVIKNSASGNATNYYVVANNHIATIVPSPVNGATISGNSGGVQLTTDPNSNFVN